MKCVYILQSVCGEHFYVGITDDLDDRLRAHNGGHAPHTSKFGPWRIRTCLGFNDEKRAFERHLKGASGRAFASKRL